METKDLLMIAFFIVGLSTGLIIGYLFGWIDGAMTISSAYEILEIKETLNLTSEITTDYIVLN